MIEESDGLKLRVIRSVATADLTGMAGMVKASARGVPRRLEDFDPASLLKRSRRGKPWLRALASIERITFEDRDALLVALDAFDKGLDLADALHIARSSRASGFATFDQRLAKRAKSLALTPPVEFLV